MSKSRFSRTIGSQNANELPSLDLQIKGRKSINRGFRGSVTVAYPFQGNEYRDLIRPAPRWTRKRRPLYVCPFSQCVYNPQIYRQLWEG